jgi:hypothetical protein
VRADQFLVVCCRDPTSLGVSGKILPPWCFAVRSDHLLQLLSEFLTGVDVFSEFSSNFFFIIIFISLCIVCSKLFQLEGDC